MTHEDMSEELLAAAGRIELVCGAETMVVVLESTARLLESDTTFARMCALKTLSAIETGASGCSLLEHERDEALAIGDCLTRAVTQAYALAADAVASVRADLEAQA